MTGQRQKRTSQKLGVYETLHSLNQGFEQVLADLRRFDKSPLFRRQLLHVLSVVIEETRAWANFEIVEVMHEHELSDWTRFSKLHRDWEKRYRDPNDVLLEAEELKQKRRKSVGKSRSKGGKVRRP